ncbi:amidase [Aspergillus taichungensis]|uniref:amidase n=1 Tax=Aspergillus taichungensis TaxID=482145 RepID=A0A2J5I864_9EURO|nr:amidase [Aspergillus taichungensis]
MTITTWEQKAQAKQAAAAAKIPAEWRLPEKLLQDLQQQGPAASVLNIPRECGLLTQRELDITETVDATALLARLASRELTSSEVTVAFCKRAAIAQQLTGCLTETFFEIAVQRAKEVDDHLATTGNLIGPLHGLPISLKENLNVSGVPTCLGYISFLDHPAKTTNSVLVDILLAAGAVLYVKTNIPQTLMTTDSHNNVFGRVLNPHRRSLTAGGSSGGEGALIALRGSLLGVGTDIGGSIRIPALCCGLAGFKPTVGRIPNAGQAIVGRAGLAGILSVTGPLCHSMRDAELFIRTVLNSHPEDVDDVALAVPWQQPPAQPVLTIGLLPEDPNYPLHPPMRRTLVAATSKLQAAGHKLVDLTGKIPPLSESTRIASRMFQMDPDKTPVKNILAGGEPPVPSLELMFNMMATDVEPTLRELYDLNVARAKFTADMRRVYLENGLDVILGPAFQSCAPPHDTFGWPVYTVLSNLLDYPACIVPFGQANEADDAAFTRDVKYVPEYRPQEVEGAPCHVQLIARRMKDEALLRYAQTVEKVLA